MIQTSDGSYLAVGSQDWNGALWRSIDATIWSEIGNVPPVDSQEVKGLSGVIETGDGYLAWGGGGARYSEASFTVIWTSTDGIEWVETARWTGFLLGVAEGGPGFVAVGSKAGLDHLYGALAWSSIDGVTWTESPLVPGEGGTGMLDLAPFQGGFLAVGASRGEDGWIRGMAWSSQDGIHWTLESNGLEVDGGLSRLSVSDGRLVAGGSITVDPLNGGLERPVIRVSDQGSAWTQVFARDCCGNVTDVVNRDGDILAAYRWWLPDGAGGQALLLSTGGNQWEEIGALGLDSGVLWLRLLNVGGSLGVIGLGLKDIGNDEFQPVLLLPPATL